MAVLYFPLYIGRAPSLRGVGVIHLVLCEERYLITAVPLTNVGLNEFCTKSNSKTTTG